VVLPLRESSLKAKPPCARLVCLIFTKMPGVLAWRRSRMPIETTSVNALFRLQGLAIHRESFSTSGWPGNCAVLLEHRLSRVRPPHNPMTRAALLVA